MRIKAMMFWFILAAMAGISLFHTSQEVQTHSGELKKINVSIAQEKETLKVLKAEWSYLNQPERIENLAKEHLKMGVTDVERYSLEKDFAPEIVDNEEPPVQSNTLRSLSLLEKEYPERKAMVEKKSIAMPKRKPSFSKSAKVYHAPKAQKTTRKAPVKDFSSLLRQLEKE